MDRLYSELSKFIKSQQTDPFQHILSCGVTILPSRKVAMINQICLSQTYFEDIALQIFRSSRRDVSEEKVNELSYAISIKYSVRFAKLMSRAINDDNLVYAELENWRRQLGNLIEKTLKEHLC